MWIWADPEFRVGMGCQRDAVTLMPSRCVTISLSKLQLATGVYRLSTWLACAGMACYALARTHFCGDAGKEIPYGAKDLRPWLTSSVFASQMT